MARFEIVQGKPGQGKSLYTAMKTKELLKRNKKWYEKTGIVRPIHSNIRFTQDFVQEAGLFLIPFTKGKYHGKI